MQEKECSCLSDTVLETLLAARYSSHAGHEEDSASADPHCPLPCNDVKSSQERLNSDFQGTSPESFKKRDCPTSPERLSKRKRHTAANEYISRLADAQEIKSMVQAAYHAAMPQVLPQECGRGKRHKSWVSYRE